MNNDSKLNFAAVHSNHLTHSLNTRSGSTIDELKYGDKIKEWLPNMRFELLYKATVYVVTTTPQEERRRAKHECKEAEEEEKERS